MQLTRRMSSSENLVIRLEYLYVIYTGNIAYNKNAEQGEGVFLSSLHAMRATDGNHYGICAQAWIGEEGPAQPAWWRADLGDTYVVLGINVLRIELTYQLSNFSF